jgi:hypothetical protein
MNTVLGVFGIKDLSCIGGQAFKKSDLEGLVNDLKAKTSALQNTQNLADLLTFLSWDIAYHTNDKTRLSSKCSMDYKQQYIDKCTELFNQLKPLAPMYETKSHKADFKGADIQYITYTPKVLQNLQTATAQTTIGAGTGVTGTVTTDTQGTTQNAIIPDSIMSQLIAQSSTSGVPLDTLQSTYLNGGFSIGNDGKIIWGVNAGNAQNNTLSYIFLLGGAFLIYMAFFKKK